MKSERVKTARGAFTYTYIDIYDKLNSHDKKKIDTIKQICEKDVFLKPDKDNKLVMKNNLKFKNN